MINKNGRKAAQLSLAFSLVCFGMLLAFLLSGNYVSGAGALLGCVVLALAAVTIIGD